MPRRDPVPRGTDLPPPPRRRQGKGDSRASFLWDLGGGLEAPASFSPGAGALSGLHPGPSAGIAESPPTPADTGGSFGTAAVAGFPRGSLELVGTALGGTLIPCPSGLGMLGIFSRLTTGTNKLGREFGAGWGGLGQSGPAAGKGTEPPVPALTRGCCPCPAARAGAGLARGHPGASPAAPWPPRGSRQPPAAR